MSQPSVPGDAANGNGGADSDNPFWAAAKERLRNVGVMQQRPAQLTGYNTVFPYAGAPLYSQYSSMYGSGGSSVPPPPPPPPPGQPSSGGVGYDWYATASPTPVRLPVHSTGPPRMPHHAFTRPRGPVGGVSFGSGGNAVPYAYANRQNRPLRFNIASNSIRPLGNRFPMAQGNVGNDEIVGPPGSNFVLRGKHPQPLKDYVQRSFEHCKDPESRRKCEDYLYAKVEPLLVSGAVFAVKWENEQLPHEKNYQVMTWTPASQLKNHQKPVSHERRRPSPPPSHQPGRYGALSPAPRPSAPPSRLGISASSHFMPPPPPMAKLTKKEKKRRQALDQLDSIEFKKARPSISSGDGRWQKASFLRDWIRHREAAPARSDDLHVIAYKDRPFRLRVNLPPFDGSRLARSFPTVLETIGQQQVNDYYSRTEGRFDPNDCEEVVGTSYEIEKKYFRLTKKPDASEIRPPTVLMRSFKKLQDLAGDESKYKYVCDQLRSIRQDLTVQKIRDKFTVQVYEFHARITLENKDLSEFNQCQTQLRHLYADIPGCKNEFEFTAYRLLYYILTESAQDVLSLLNDLTQQARRSPSVSFAIRVHDAYLKGQYIQLFKLYQQTPRLCGNVMQLFLDRERKRFFNVIRVSYRPTIGIDVLTRWFNFDGEKEATDFLKTQGVDIECGASSTAPASWPSRPTAQQ